MSTQSKKTSVKTPNDQRSDALNNNRGTTGHNIINTKKDGHRGAQLNPNRKP